MLYENSDWGHSMGLELSRRRWATRLSLLATTLALLTGMAAEALAQRASAPLTGPIDERALATLEGNTRPEANAANDRGAVAADMRLDHMILQLRRSPAQEAAVERFADSLQDPASPNYHRWLSADEFGARFGASAADLDSIEGWLAAHGLTVNSVYPSGMEIDFSGTAGQVEAAFHTEIHHLDVGGVAHIANMSDPRIPAALAPAVAGIVSLHDFRPHNKHKPSPRFTDNNCDGPCYLMAPADLATIYNFKPLFRAGISGKGQTVAVAEDTDLYKTTDWTTFRTTFELNVFTSGTLITVHPTPKTGANNCRDPGVNSDDIEATLDAEWASAAAPDATIMLASCDNTATTDGVYLAILNLVNGKTTAPIISVSYGNCEAENGQAYNAAFNKLYQQAAVAGISVFVATGDTGASDCADDGTLGDGTKFGIGVNAWAVTQYNVAVGGTDFSDSYFGTNTSYWASTSVKPWGTAKSYIPETPWNDTCASSILAASFGFKTSYGTTGFCNDKTNGANFLAVGGGEGGPSGCYTGTPKANGVVGGTCKGYPKPSWQTGVVGIPKDGVRDVPDVAMFAADGVWWHYYMLCFTDPANGGGPCTANPASWPPGGGGTSYATPIVAGIQALVNQKKGGKTGNPAPTYYKLAATEYGKSGNPDCYSNRGKAVAATCIFNDVTFGDDIQDCKPPNDCYDPSGAYGVLSASDSLYEPAYRAGIGYDYPTGIGTINASNLVDHW